MGPLLKWFEDQKFSAVIRSSSADDAEEMIKSASAGGIKIFEISLQTPQAMRLIETFSKKEGMLIGAGTVTDGEVAQRAINAGAKFLSTQYTDRDVISVAKNNDSFVIQGAFTPTEVFDAYQAGADLVQIWHATIAGGPNYFRALREILPFVKLTAYGGVSLDNAFEYLKHSVSVSIRKALFDRSIIRQDNWGEVKERAKQFSQKLETLKITK